MKHSMNWLIGFLVFCMLLLSISSSIPAHPSPQNHYVISRQIQYSFTLQNGTGSLIEEAGFWAFAPVKETSTQRCYHLKSSHPYELITDDLGNQILRFTLHGLAPYATRLITIKADLMVSTSPATSGLVDVQPFLKAEKFIECDHPDLLRIANELRTPKTMETAEKIFAWVVNHVRYTGYTSDERGALYAYRHREGDCTEFMYLFVALCRAAGVPARCVGGYICRGNAILRPADYHNWAEFYEGGSWRLADPQRKVLMKSSSDYVATRIMDGSQERSALSLDRFRFEGPGLKAAMN
jgi:transglutaminase-like putative cysteine protease